MFYTMLHYRPSAKLFWERLFLKMKQIFGLNYYRKQIKLQFFSKFFYHADGSLMGHSIGLGYPVI